MSSRSTAKSCAILSRTRTEVRTRQHLWEARRGVACLRVRKERRIRTHMVHYARAPTTAWAICPSAGHGSEWCCLKKGNFEGQKACASGPDASDRNERLLAAAGVCSACSTAAAGHRAGMTRVTVRRRRLSMSTAMSTLERPPHEPRWQPPPQSTPSAFWISTARTEVVQETASASDWRSYECGTRNVHEVRVTKKQGHVPRRLGIGLRTGRPPGGRRKSVLQKRALNPFVVNVYLGFLAVCECRARKRARVNQCPSVRVRRMDPGVP